MAECFLSTDSTCIHEVRLEFLWRATQFKEFTASFANSVVSLRRLCVCCVRRHPFTIGGVGQQGRRNMSRSQGESGRGTARDIIVKQLEGIPSQSQLCIVSAGGAPTQREPRPRRPRPLSVPGFLHFRRDHRASVSAFLVLCITSLSCANRPPRVPRPS